MNSIEQSEQHLVIRKCDTYRVEHKKETQASCAKRRLKWERKNNILNSNTCICLAMPGEWNGEKKTKLQIKLYVANGI